MGSIRGRCREPTQIGRAWMEATKAQADPAPIPEWRLEDALDPADPGRVNKNPENPP